MRRTPSFNSTWGPTKQYGPISTPSPMRAPSATRAVPSIAIYPSIDLLLRLSTLRVVRKTQRDAMDVASKVAGVIVTYETNPGSLW